MRDLKQGLALDSAQPALAMMLARLQVDSGEAAFALQTLQASRGHAQDDAYYQAFLAALLQRHARHREAVEQYLLALKLIPQNALWWIGAGISLQADNRAKEAREAFGYAASSGSLSPELRLFAEQKLIELSR